MVERRNLICFLRSVFGLVLSMKSFLVLLIFSFFVCNSSWRIFHRGRGKGGFLGDAAVETEFFQEGQYFDQKLDHFDPSNARTWKQRYFENSTFYATGGPIFLMINGEAEASPLWVNKGAWIDYAKKYEAHCVLLEHRFYGESHPTDDLSTKNLKYLTSEQALADAAWFIISFNRRKHFEVPPKWIVFGGSYAGSLAAWMRLKYPHLVHGAVSSSGPLLALPNFKEYFAVVRDSLAAFNPDCVTAIENGTRQISSLLADPLGECSAFTLFDLCDPLNLNNADDVSNLYDILAENFAYAVQYDKLSRRVDNRIVRMSIDKVCSIMLNETIGAEVNRLAAVNALFLKEMQEPCLDFRYGKMIEEMRGIDWNGKGASGERQWTYQTCSEFGFFATSDFNDTEKMFGNKFPLRFFNKQCTDIFGKKFNGDFVEKATEVTNMVYGGLDNQAVNVVYVHGSTDPWHALGITKTLIAKAPAILVNGTAHCANMFEPSSDDPPQLAATRKQVEGLIGEWLAQ